MFDAMAMAQHVPDGQARDACAKLRDAVSSHCDAARLGSQAHAEAGERTRALRRDLVTAQHQLSAASEAADPKQRTAEKAAARDAYLLSQQLAQTDAERREATGTWARAVDRINRSGRAAARAVSKVKAQIARIEEDLRGAERAEQAARIRAEAAEAACLDARVRLAACEEMLAAGGPVGPVTAFDPHAATGGHAVMLGEAPHGEPLVIEAMVGGDRRVLDEAALAIAEHAASSPAEVRLQLQELVDAIISAASSQGFLVFDQRHPLWAHLSFEEARDVIAALARLGFQSEPAEGWHAGRAPAPADLSMALAYAGLDARNMRDLPSAQDLRELPRSIGVDARAFLATLAPDLAIDHVVLILDRRAARLEPLWNAWGQVRPILLSERRSLGSLPD